MTCVTCNQEETIDRPFVHSGVDAFVLNCIEHVERICYICAIRDREKVQS